MLIKMALLTHTTARLDSFTRMSKPGPRLGYELLFSERIPELQQELPPELLPYFRLAYCTDEAVVRRGKFDTPVSGENEQIMLYQLVQYLQKRLKG